MSINEDKGKKEKGTVMKPSIISYNSIFLSGSFEVPSSFLSSSIQGPSPFSFGHSSSVPCLSLYSFFQNHPTDYL